MRSSIKVGIRPYRYSKVSSDPLPKQLRLAVNIKENKA